MYTIDSFYQPSFLRQLLEIYPVVYDHRRRISARTECILPGTVGDEYLPTAVDR